MHRDPRVPTPIADTAALAWGEDGLQSRSPIGNTLRLQHAHGSGTSLGALRPIPVETNTAGALRIQRRLGEGGMGVIDAALDPSLGRTVAVKRAHRDAAGACAAALVEEGRTLARLDHPNVVPVYALGLAEDGAPLLVMKEIEGRKWSELIEERADLERDLSIFAQLGEALRFAHARSVLHRDVKLDNVMIGSFGEVYLMDWGCACPMEGAATTQIVGTPGNMPAEMFELGAVIDARTDLYLLGATLYQAVTGRFRNRGSQLFEVIASAWTGHAGDYGPEVPQALARILDRACARQPHDRYESVAALLGAVREFQQHRGALSVAEAGRRAALRFDGALTGGAAAADAAFFEAKVHYHSALLAWPGFDRAQEEWDTLVDRYLAWKIGSGELGAAAHQIAELEVGRRAPWLEKLHHAEAEKARNLAILRGQDLRSTAKEWRTFGLILAAAGLGMATVVAAGKGKKPFTPTEVIQTAMIPPVLVGLAIIPVRRVLFEHHLSRVVLRLLIVFYGASIVHRVTAVMAGASVPDTLRADLILAAACSVMMGAAVEPRLMLAGVPYLLAAVATMYRPELSGAIYPAGALPAMLVAIFVLGGRIRRDRSGKGVESGNG